MPAWRLDAQQREVNQYDVGATDAALPHFVKHVFLCLAERPFTLNIDSPPVSAVHMGPPLEERTQPLNVLASALLDQAGVPPSEHLQIKEFVDERLGERKSQESRLARLQGLEPYFAEYVIHPPHIEADENVPLWRFSCAGFVLKAYEAAKIRLIDVDGLPVVTLETLKTAYPRMARILDRASNRERLGLGEGDSWPVVLAGYVANSLARSRTAIRNRAYRPKAGDEYFPSHRPRRFSKFRIHTPCVHQRPQRFNCLQKVSVKPHDAPQRPD